jgi:ribulose-phosphate 3-epimerase
MAFWDNFDGGRLLAEVSLWSADFTCLGYEIERIDPFADLYHIDASDAHFVPGLLFFPDLVAALRGLTRKSFHVHLMAQRPLDLIADFARAGANVISIHAENGSQVVPALKRIRDLGLAAGLALSLETPLVAAVPYIEQIDLVILMGTALGVKGQDLSPLAVPRIGQMAVLLHEHGVDGRVKIEADGAIREHTVPALRASGADLVVMGSLAFKSQDLDQTFAWLHNLPGKM